MFIINVGTRIIVDGIRALVHVIEVADGFNATDKRLLSMLMIPVQLICAAVYNSHMTMHSSTSNIDIGLTR